MEQLDNSATDFAGQVELEVKDLQTNTWERVEVKPSLDAEPGIRLCSERIGEIAVFGVFNGRATEKNTRVERQVRPENISLFYISSPEGPGIGSHQI